jgi:hypothetical protein
MGNRLTPKQGQALISEVYHSARQLIVLELELELGTLAQASAETLTHRKPNSRLEYDYYPCEGDRIKKGLRRRCPQSPALSTESLPHPRLGGRDSDPRHRSERLGFLERRKILPPVDIMSLFPRSNLVTFKNLRRSLDPNGIFSAKGLGDNIQPEGQFDSSRTGLHS